MKFLMGLNESYAQTRSNIINMDPLPNMNKAYAMVLRHEKQAETSTGKLATPAEASAFSIKKVTRDFTPVNGEGKYCDKCNMNNHNTKNCRAHLKCTYCNGKGHTYEYCRRRRKTAEGSQGRSKVNHVAPQSHDKGALLEFPFSREECQQLLSQLLTRSASANLVGNIPNYEELSGKSFQFSQRNMEICWILDSGASDHIVCSSTLLTSLTPVKNHWVKLPNGNCTPVTHIGTVVFSSHFVLHNVLCVPIFYLNLISVSKLAYDSFYITIFLRQVCFIQDLRPGKTIGTGTEKEGLYCLNLSRKATCNAVSTISDNLWHQRLGHPSTKTSSLFPFFFNKSCIPSSCSICPLAKLTRQPFPLSTTRSAACFDLIHIDIWGGYHVPSSSGAKYFLTLVDDHSRSTWIYLLKHKSEARTFLIHFIHLVANQFSKTVKIIRSDNGPEFKISDFYSSKGIIHQTSCVNTPQQNGVAERKYRHLLNVARALLFQANLPKHFWGDAILTAAYLINRTPTPVLKGKTPFECLFNAKPNFSHLKVFGCQCFVSTHPTRPSKFDPRAHECVFIGYPHGQKGYKVYNLTTQHTTVSRDVTFFEHVFPFKTS